MNKKFFVIDETINPLSKRDIREIERKKAKVRKSDYELKKEDTKKKLNSDDVFFRHTENRIIVKADTDYKDKHTFENGTEIFIGRRFNNLNRRETEPVNAWVISGDGIPKGAEILVHQNSLVDTNKIFGYKDAMTSELGNSVRYYSIDTHSAFLWRMGDGEWQPIKNYVIADRVFKPYEGSIEGILPTQIKNVLYIRSGEYAGKVAHTLKGCDFEVIFMDLNGRENRIIRCRHYENEYHDREELICIDHYLTENVSSGTLLIGLSPTDCKELKQL